MKFDGFEDIIVWQKSRILSIKIYEIFKNNRDYGFKDQICRAGVSIMNNIAEGFERSSNKEFRNFLFISKGSAAEVRSMLYLSFEFKFITQSQFQELNSLCLEISKMLSGLIKTL